MKNLFITGLFIIFYSLHTSGQSGNVVLVEEFTETGCGACAEYDSAFQAMTNKYADKIAMINYHCFYSLDTFYQYNKMCDNRYNLYKLKFYPSAMANGLQPEKTSAHLTNVKAEVIEKLYNRDPQFKFEVTGASTGKGNGHSALLKIKTTALTECPEKDLRIYVVATENNINHKERYHAKSVNGINEFNHIMRSFLTGPEGKPIGTQKKGKVTKLKITYINDDKEINYKEVRIVVFIQDQTTHEVFGAYVMKEHPFQ